jgi:hypothetical protein
VTTPDQPAAAEWMPPPRGLLGATASTDEDGNPTLEVACDCATTTLFVFEKLSPIETREVAVTCDGCHSVRWLTVVATQPDAAGSAT